MALQTPVVATALPNTIEATDGCARLVPVDDVAALAAAVTATLEDKTETERQVAAALARFDREFAIERAADGMLTFYERALR
jgi:glycosyltransferase involved in cell wall biosynthesis